VLRPTAKRSFSEKHDRENGTERAGPDAEQERTADPDMAL